MTNWFQQALAESNAQTAEYRAARAASPADYGNSPDGAWDHTHPDHGPSMMLCFDGKGIDEPWWLLWCVHKHRWPFEYIYCFGRAKDSRGERTDLMLTLDVRDLPKKYIGRLKLHARANGDRRSHQQAIARALADGYDLHEHARRIEAERQAEHAARVATMNARLAASHCKTCGDASSYLTSEGECDLCDQIPF